MFGELALPRNCLRGAFSGLSFNVKVNEFRVPHLVFGVDGSGFSVECLALSGGGVGLLRRLSVCPVRLAAPCAVRLEFGVQT